MIGKSDTGITLSATDMAEHLKKTPQAVNQLLLDMGLLAKTKNAWQLTPAGKARGGIQTTTGYRTIIWPVSVLKDLDHDHTPSQIEQNLLTSTLIGNHFGITAPRANYFLSDLGWIRKEGKGWVVTELGKRLGGLQSHDRVSREPYVRWPQSVVNNPILVKIVHPDAVATPEKQNPTQSLGAEQPDVRKKYPTDFRAIDGHWVRSQGEQTIDDFLCYHQIFHCYEKKLNTEEEVISDFFLPGYKVYIEYWGISGDNPRYQANKKRKLEIYRRENLALIEIELNDIMNLEDALTRKLRVRGIKLE